MASGNQIYNLTDEQRDTLRDYIQEHREYETHSLNPLTLARVLAGDKRGGYINPIYSLEEERGDPDKYLPTLFERLDIPFHRIKGGKGYCISRTDWRLSILPTVMEPSDSYHRRCGAFYDYPREAVEDFIETTIEVTYRDLIRAGMLEAHEVAYTTFVPYTYHNSIEKAKQLIEEGKRIRNRYSELAEEWHLPELEMYAEEVYRDFVDSYSGNGGTFPALMTFPPEKEVTPKDVKPLLSPMARGD